MYIDYKELGSRIAKVRNSLGLKQVTVNERAELSDKYLSHIENARTTPSIDVLMKLYEVLDTTPDYLLLGTIKNESKMAENIKQKIKLIIDSEQKCSLLSSFLDWIIDQKM